MLRPLLCLWLGLTFIFLSGCGGDGGSTIGSSGGGGPAIPAGERLSAVTLLSDAYLAALKADESTALTTTLDAVKRHPLVASAEIIEGSGIACQFTDGVRMTIGNSRKQLAGAPAAPVNETADARAPVPQWLPKGSSAAIFNALHDDSSMTSYAQEVAQGLIKGGYSLAGGKVMKGTVDEFRSLSNLGFLYVESHGTIYKRSRLDNRYVSHFALVTSHIVDEAGLAQFGSDLLSEDIAITILSFRDSSGELQSKRVFSLTDNWLIRQSWFSESSIAFLNCCNSAIPLMREFVSQMKIGVWLGWNDAVDDAFATKAIKRFYTLMADTNGDRSSWQEALEAMEKERLLADLRLNPPTRLLHGLGKSSADSLLPRIDSVSVNESTLEAEVKGVFGSTPGVVLENGIQGRSLTVKSWSSSLIKVQLKNTTHSISAKINTRETGLHRLKVWTISGPDGRGFYAKNRVRLLLANRDLTGISTLVDEPVGAAEGLKGPFYFHADPGKRIELTIWSDTTTGGFGEVWIMTPAGTKKRFYEAMSVGPVQQSNGLVNLMVGWAYLDRF